MTETREETKDHETRREKDIEQSEHEEEAINELVAENLGHEEVMWPFMNMGDMGMLCILEYHVLLGEYSFNTHRFYLSPREI